MITNFGFLVHKKLLDIKLIGNWVKKKQRVYNQFSMPSKREPFEKTLSCHVYRQCMQHNIVQFCSYQTCHKLMIYCQVIFFVQSASH